MASLPDRFQIITTTGTDTGTFSQVTLAPAFTTLVVNYQSVFTELFSPVNAVVPQGLADAIVAAAAGTTAKTTGIAFFTSADRGMMCLVGDVELLYYPQGEPIRVPK